MLLIVAPLLLLGALVQNAETRFLDMRFDVKLSKVPPECLENSVDKECNLPFVLSLLRPSESYDLSTVRLLDGQMKKFDSDRHFKADTVLPVPLSQNLTEFFVGIKIFGVPSSAQNYFVLDGSKALKENGGSKVKTRVESGIMVFRGRIKEGRKARHSQSAGKICNCVHRNCGCCEHVTVKKIHLDDTVCVNVTYLPKPEYGLRFSVSLDGRILYEDTVSVRNPPPLCFAVPHLKEFASLCIRFHDISVQSKSLHSCVELQAELMHVKIAEKELGCFNIPL